MKKIVLCFAFIVVYSGLYAQTSTSAVDTSYQPKSLSIGIMFNPGYSFRTLKSTDASTVGYVAMANKNEAAAVRFDVGLRLKADLSSRLQLCLGLGYSQRGYNVNVSDTNPVTKDVVNFAQQRKYAYLDFPLTIGYRFAGLDTTVAFRVIGGISNSFLQNVSNTDGKFNPAGGVDVEHTSPDPAGYISYQWGLIGAVEISVGVSENFRINIQPNFRYTFSNSAPTTLKGLDQHFYTGGLGIGFDFRF